MVTPSQTYNTVQLGSPLSATPSVGNWKWRKSSSSPQVANLETKNLQKALDKQQILCYNKDVSGGISWAVMRNWDC
jgi:hypothetical protein